MKKIELVEISEQIMDKLFHEYKNSPVRKVREKAGTLYYRAKGKTEKEITTIMGVAVPTITRHVKNFNKSGIQYVYTTKYKGQKSKLYPFEDQVAEALEKDLPQTIDEAVEKVYQLFNVKVSNSALRKFMRKRGFKYLKARSKPAKADKEKQQEFYDNKLKHLIDSAQKRDIVLLFGDAVHLIYGGELGYIWCKERQEIQTSSGRKRYNVFGCYNLITNETITITNDSYITSSEIVEAFKKIREQNGTKPVYIILDNARYQKCKLVEEASKKYDINIVYLPPYSPNLNLIERLWKLLRKTCLCNKYHETFDDFCKCIDEFLSSTSTTYKDAVSTLLTPKFEI